MHLKCFCCQLHTDPHCSPLQAECVQHGLRTLAFCKTRKLCELVTAYTRETLRDTAPHLTDTISVYRAGYSPQVRPNCVFQIRVLDDTLRPTSPTPSPCTARGTAPRWALARCRAVTGVSRVAMAWHEKG